MRIPISSEIPRARPVVIQALRLLPHASPRKIPQARPGEQSGFSGAMVRSGPGVRGPGSRQGYDRQALPLLWARASTCYLSRDRSSWKCPLTTSAP